MYYLPNMRSSTKKFPNLLTFWDIRCYTLSQKNYGEKPVEALGRIKLPEDSRAKAQRDLQEILQYIDTLSELDTEGIEPMSHALPLTNVMREDAVEPSVPAEEVLANAPAKKDDYFLVPRSFE